MGQKKNFSTVKKLVTINFCSSTVLYRYGNSCDKIQILEECTALVHSKNRTVSILVKRKAKAMRVSLHSDLGDKLKKDVKDKSETLEGDKKKYYPLPYSVNQSRY